MTTISEPLTASPTASGFAFNPDGRGLVAAVWAEHRWLLAIFLIHRTLALGLNAAGLLDIPALPWNGAYVEKLLVLSSAWLGLLIIADAVRRRDPARTQRRYLTARSLIGMGLGALFIARESLLHEAFKRNLGRAANPFRWDAALSHADRVVHFGKQPWRWIDPLFHSDAMTRALDLGYVAWFFLILFASCWIIVLADRPLRSRAFLTYGLVWLLLGTVTSQIVSSAGPVYFHHIVAGPDPYAPLLAHLDSVHISTGLFATEFQAALWANYFTIHEQPWFHISAMPSMHVAIPALFALILHRWNWRAGAVMWSYTAFILLGSIYLGWHYALDGYVSIIGVLSCWWLAGRLLGRSVSSCSPQHPSSASAG